jgi:hypothetical protein
MMLFPISKPKKYNKIIIAGHSGSLIGMIAANNTDAFLLPVLEELLMLL